MPKRPMVTTLLLPLLVLAACGTDPGPAAAPVPPTGTNAPTTPDTTTPDTTTPDTTVPDTTVPDSAPSSTPPSEPADGIHYDPDDVRADLDAARLRWETQGWGSYRFVYTPTCFCPPDEVNVHVLGDRIVDPPDTGSAWTVEQWFDRIDTAIGTAADIRVTFRDDGAPTSLYVDESETMADEEYGFELVDLEPVSDGLDVFLDAEYGCGYRFAIASERQTASMVVGFDDIDDWETGPTPGTYELADLNGTVRFGRDLMANWCDDVIEEGEPEPVIDEEWEIVDGVLELTHTDNRLAIGTFVDVVAEDPDGDEHDLGDVEVANGMWGFFAG
jgi:hypothetical protein